MSDTNKFIFQPDAARSYRAISEMARNLARTLQAAPAQESRRAAALRRYLIAEACILANASDHVGDSTDQETFRAYSTHVRKIRMMSVELSQAPFAVPPGIGTVMEAFAEKFLPDTLLILRPRNLFGYNFREHLTGFHEQRRKIALPLPAQGAGMPAQFRILSFPHGEQDNVLASCCLLPAFSPDTSRRWIESSAFATWALGPAYFFAFAEDAETGYPGNTGYDLIDLSLAFDQLQSLGWMEHPQIGPLLDVWRRRFGLHPDYISAHLNDRKFLDRAMEIRKMFSSKAPNYTPADFDRDVPRLWERLRQLLPPNDLELDAVESSQPADEISILNAGWSFYLLHMDDLYKILGSKTAEDRYEAKQVLNRLLTKGIELSSIARRWKEAREDNQP